LQRRVTRLKGCAAEESNLAIRMCIEELPGYKDMERRVTWLQGCGDECLPATNSEKEFFHGQNYLKRSVT